jgi:hypothetical protein
MLTNEQREKAGMLTWYFQQMQVGKEQVLAPVHFGKEIICNGTPFRNAWIELRGRRLYMGMDQARRQIEAQHVLGMGVLPKAEEQLVAELHRNYPDMKESEVKALLKPWIASKFKKPEAGRENARRRPKSVTTMPARKRICCAWLELKSSLGKRKRANLADWMDLVRQEFPQADSAVVKKVRCEVYEYHRLNCRAD